MKLILQILFFLFISFLSTHAQRMLKISVDNNGKESTLSYVSRKGIAYASGKDLASLLTANQFYNSEAAKLEIKFSDYSLKFTAKNQFVIITRKPDNTQNIFQIPISTMLLNNDVFVPLIYCTDYLSLVFGNKILFDDKAKHLKITNEPFTPEIFFTTARKEPEITTEEKPTVDKVADTKISLKYDIYDITIEDKSNGTLVRLKSSRKLNIPRHSINNNVLFVFFPNVTIDPNITTNVKPAGLVKGLKRTPVSFKNNQLEFTLGEGFSTSEAFQAVESNDIMITIHNKLFTAQIPTVDEAKSKWVFDSVVIDAGHGGKDPGAIGVKGVREKDVNLTVALKLGKLIEKNMPDVKVIYTRKTDDFIELYKRGKIANEAGGKLFISIHSNSMVKKNTDYRGFEVYLLRPGRTQEAIEIAEFENSVIKLEDNPDRYQKLTDENFILVSMAHSQYMRYSERFSDLLNQEWKKGVTIPSLGIKQAGFYVLVGASMPSVLVEAGFLSNRKDEAHLASSGGQTEIAQAIYTAVRKYKEFYDKAISD